MAQFPTSTALRIAAGMATLTMAGWLVQPAAMASDYANECTSLDKRYAGQPAALYLAADKQQAQKLTYAVLDEQLLEEKRSHCLSNAPAAQGQKFQNLFRKSRQTVIVDEVGGQRKAVLICELAASGLPAAFNCDRDVVTALIKKPGPVKSYKPGTPGTWTHNGSVMRLEADGAVRRLTYMNPREGIRRAGVSAESVLFEGVREGNRYNGTARIFSKACGEQPFEVEGTVSADESRIELKGTAKLVDDACRASGTREESLVFERVK